MEGRLDVLPGALPTLRDWTDHMTTAFPEVRLKKYLEMRGADGGPWSRLCALPAFWVGLLYDDAALDAAWDLVKDFTHGRTPRAARRRAEAGAGAAVPRRHAARPGPRARWRFPLPACGGAPCRTVAAPTKRGFLDPLVEIVESGQTPAERKLELFHGEWHGSVDPVFREFAY